MSDVVWRDMWILVRRSYWMILSLMFIIVGAIFVIFDGDKVNGSYWLVLGMGCYSFDLNDRIRVLEKEIKNSKEGLGYE